MTARSLLSNGHRTRPLGGRLRASIRRALRREDGAATVEFVLLFPAFLLVFISAFESSIMLFRQVMLERGVDIATRELRLDGSSTIGRNKLRTDICNEARILPNCVNNLEIELEFADMVTFQMPSSRQPCIDRRESTALSEEELPDNRASRTMILRACFTADTFMPTVGLGTQLVSTLDDESLHIVAATAFEVEPP